MESWMQAHIGPGLSAVEAMLEGGSFCFGDDVSLADLCLMPQVYNAERWGIDMSEMPKIQKVARNLSVIQAFADAHHDAMKPAP
jgi:maleylacetoacetate isomerase